MENNLDQISTELNELRKMVQDIKETKNNCLFGNLMSPQIDKLIPALINAAKEFKTIALSKEVKVTTGNGKSYAFKYADLASCFEAIKPALWDNGIFLSQPVVDENDRTYLCTIALHSSGQFIGSRIQLFRSPEEETKLTGGDITYFRRYLLSLFGVCADEDNDCSGSNKDVSEIKKEYPKKQIASDNESPFISSDQRDYIMDKLKGYNDIAKRMKEHLKIEAISSMLKKDYAVTLDKVLAQINDEKSRIK